MNKSPIRKDIEACGGTITDTIMDNVFEVEYKNHQWWIGRPAEVKKYVAQFADDAIAGEMADFCEPNKQALQQFLDQKIKERSKSRRYDMQIEYVERIVVTCDKKDQKEIVHRLAEHNVDEDRIVEKKTIIRNKETGEEYFSAGTGGR